MDGIYIVNENGDYHLTESCKLDLYIDDFKGNEQCHVNIIKFKKDKRSDVSFNEFKSMLNCSKFRIYLDFYSDFAKAIYLKGNINNTEVEIIVTEIKDLSIKI